MFDIISENQFKLLYYLLKNEYVNQRELSDVFGFSLGKINSILKELIEKNYLSVDYKVISKGKIALKPYKVDNAIIMAAGTSSRFAPLSYEKPKGLLTVRGEVLIERQIKQLFEAGITDITVVVGYMKEKFFYLQEKYGVKIAVNEDYYRYNNISSVHLVLDQLKNTYLCSSDNYFTENVFDEYVYDSYYAAQYSEEYIDEWCMKCNSKGIITDVKVGDSKSLYMIGHAYFSKAFSNAISKLIMQEYDLPGVKDGYWEALYIRHLDELKMRIKPYENGVICEFDSLEELRKFDPSYATNVDSRIFDNIKMVLNCQDGDIQIIRPIKNGTTNMSFLFLCKGEKYIYKHPNSKSNEYIKFTAEASVTEAIFNAGFDTTCIYVDKNKGWKILRYVSNSKQLDYENINDVKKSIDKLKQLHNLEISVCSNFDINEMLQKYDAAVVRQERGGFEDYSLLRDRFKELYELSKLDNVKKCICHGDFCDSNIIVDDQGEIFLIDWEYSGMADPSIDLATFIVCSNYSGQKIDEIIELYGGIDKKHIYAYISIMAYVWFMWAMYQESIGKIVGKSLLSWYNYANKYYDKAIKLYRGD